jgi:hypothetical protein
VVKYISVPEDSVKFTAGADKLVVALPHEGALLRYRLDNFEREGMSTALPFRGKIHAVCMGSASAGPLLVYTGETGPGIPRAGVFFLNPETFKETESRFDAMRAGAGGQGLTMVETQTEFRASPDGKLFAAWRANTIPTGIQILAVGGREVTGRYEHAHAGYLLPGADGRTLFTGIGLHGMDSLKPLSKDAGRRHAVLPAASGIFYVRLIVNPGAGRTDVQVALLGDDRTLIELVDVDGMGPGPSKPGGYGGPPPDPFGLSDIDRWRFGPDKRFHFLPEAKLIVVIPPTNDRLVLYPFDAEAALERSGRDYLVVTSQPPVSARKGSAYEYAIQVRSRRGGVKYKLEAGPTGMTVSAAGKLTWEVPTGFVEAQTNVIASVTDGGGQERFHSFTVSVRP